MSHYSSFVVKLWVDDHHRVVRGCIQHVSTQDSAYFVTLDKMLAFMMDHLHGPTSVLGGDLSVQLMAQLGEVPDG